MALNFRDTLARTVDVYKGARAESADRAVPRPLVDGVPPHLAYYDQELPPSVELEHTLARLLDVAEAELAGADRSRPASGDRHSGKRRESTRRALECRGWDSTAVAFRFGMTTDGVRKLRKRHGLDPLSGLAAS